MATSSLAGLRRESHSVRRAGPQLPVAFLAVRLLLLRVSRFPMQIEKFSDCHLCRRKEEGWLD